MYDRAGAESIPGFRRDRSAGEAMFHRSGPRVLVLALGLALTASSISQRTAAAVDEDLRDAEGSPSAEALSGLVRDLSQEGRGRASARRLGEMGERAAAAIPAVVKLLDGV